MKFIRIAVAMACLLATLSCEEFIEYPLYNGNLAGADYWSDEPRILSAGLGFTDIIGVDEVNEENVKLVGGSWYGSLSCGNGKDPEATMRTSVKDKNITNGFKGAAFFNKANSVAADALPVVFSWPVLTETVDITDFRITLNTGEIVNPTAAGMFPNWEYNERNCVVLFGDFGNRLKSTEAGARFVVKVEIIADANPLMLKGRNDTVVSAVGLSWTTTKTPYDAGPQLVGAKLNFVGKKPIGEGSNGGILDKADYLPNDEFALYGGGDFRLRMLTTGGFSPDGVTGVRPTMYEKFFRIHVKGPNGTTVMLTKTGVDYTVLGGKLKVIGLSDLGKKEDHGAGVYYDDCYLEDRDNYIDIILVGDEAAARNITFLEIPGLPGGYSAFYNPGGPGPTPYPNVRYTAPGPPDLEPVIMALDNPMRVNRDGSR
ncbi:hypothetical protein [Spirosoma linguale]|uniref:Phospholipase/carboxylesterase n=1 Tax=Spirosoma linguale (strain ATCC 33905 / DSM 74 / LMG 10896 / Claus 1) TaxID=504472 RepID=D2QBY9_SPILD|nr:phospholipase/carboxylesterase [Spirosoma linguale DSM 74]